MVHPFEVGRDGELGTRRVFLHTPDGMTSDVADNVWITFWGRPWSAAAAPTDAWTAKITLPARRSTSVCLGGLDLSRLFVTTAHHGLRRLSLHAGALFAVDVDVPPGGRIRPIVAIVIRPGVDVIRRVGNWPSRHR